MALSLLQHLQQTHASTLHSAIQEMGLNAQQASMLLDWNLSVVLAHLVDLNQRHGTGLVLALINTQAVDGLWQTLDQTEWISQTQKHLPADGLVLQLASQQVATTVLATVFELVDAASLGEEGLNELLEGQPEHLQGQAPDWVWQQSGLMSLCGQAAVEPASDTNLDLAAGIASLNQLVRQAAAQTVTTIATDTPATPAIPQSQTEHAVTSIDLHKTESHHDDAHAAHPAITLPPQRDAGGLTRLLEPLVALVLLYALYAMFQDSQTRTVVAPIAVVTTTASADSAETVLVPTVLADESELPALDSGTAATDTAATVEEAQRTGAQALQFTDNEL